MTTRQRRGYGSVRELLRPKGARTLAGLLQRHLRSRTALEDGEPNPIVITAPTHSTLGSMPLAAPSRLSSCSPLYVTSPGLHRPQVESVKADGLA